MAYGMSDEQLRASVNAYADKVRSGEMTQQQVAQQVANAAKTGGTTQTTADIARATGQSEADINSWFQSQGINPAEYFGGPSPVQTQTNALRDSLTPLGPAPTMQNTPFNFEADPGYAFRKQQGEEAINSASAARGQYFSSRVGKELADFNSGLASQEYGNAYNRYLQGNAQNYGQWSNQADRNLGIQTQGYNNAFNLDQTAYQRATEADNTNWNRAMQLSGAGQSAAGAQPPNSGQYYVNQGNAQAGGAINNANAWTGAGNNALSYYYMNNNPWAKRYGDNSNIYGSP